MQLCTRSAAVFALQMLLPPKYEDVAAVTGQSSVPTPPPSYNDATERPEELNAPSYDDATERSDEPNAHNTAA